MIMETTYKSTMQLLDIESYPNYFLLGLEDYNTNKKYDFELSIYRNDFQLIKRWLNNDYELLNRELNTNYKEKYSLNNDIKSNLQEPSFVVTFNGEHYDLIVLSYIKDNLKEIEQAFSKDVSNNTLNETDNQEQIDNAKLDVLRKIKEFSSKVIEDEMFPHWKYKDRFKNNFIHIDLYRYWSKMLRINKKISLKSLAVQMNYHHIQELPYVHNQIVTQEEMNELTKYCINNDLGILRLLVDNRKDDIKLRATIKKDFGIECWSLDAVKIANEYLIREYCNKTGENKYEVNKWKFKKNPNLKIGDVLQDKDIQFKTEYLQKVKSEIFNSKAEGFSKTLVLKTSERDNKYIKITLGIGGIHSVPPQGEVLIPEGYSLISSDIASIYPTNIINKGFIRFPEVLNVYSALKKERLRIKNIPKDKKTTQDKLMDTFYKLILNSTSGLLDNEHSWLYYNEGAVGLRLTGQLQLLRGVEECLLRGFEVISSNT